MWSTGCATPRGGFSTSWQSEMLIEENGEIYYQRLLLDCTEQSSGTAGAHGDRAPPQLPDAALSVDYNLMCHWDLDTGRGEALRLHNCPYNILEEIFTADRPLQKNLEAYISRCVYSEDQQMFRHALTYGNLRAELTSGPSPTSTTAPSAQRHVLLPDEGRANGDWRRATGGGLGLPQRG